MTENYIEILAIISERAKRWSVDECFTEAYHSLVSNGRLTPDGPVYLALTEYCACRKDIPIG